MDFTIEKYTVLLKVLKSKSYDFQTFEKFVENPASGRVIVLRHDVDLLPKNSLRTAIIENELGIVGTYYFRAVPESWDEEIIKKIHSLGHEVGYHYESLTTTSGNVERAYEDFCANLAKLREIVPVSTICMHGSPRSPYDSKDIWKHYSYKNSDIVGEPYFDTDFSQMFYLTDTGRRWDGYKVSVRDRIEGFSEKWAEEGKTFHSTEDIIDAVTKGSLPDRIMITVHPQRWNPLGLTWAKEFVLQNLKNIVKKMMIGLRK